MSVPRRRASSGSAVVLALVAFGLVAIGLYTFAAGRILPALLIALAGAAIWVAALRHA